MRLTNKTERWSMGNETYKGKYKGYECNISYSSEYYSKIPFWYFTCTSKEDKSFNSLWNSLKYNTKEECHDACIKYIDEDCK